MLGIGIAGARQRSDLLHRHRVVARIVGTRPLGKARLRRPVQAERKQDRYGKFFHRLVRGTGLFANFVVLATASRRRCRPAFIAS